MTDLLCHFPESVRNWGGKGKKPFSSSCGLGWKNGTEKKMCRFVQEKARAGWEERKTLVKEEDNELAPKRNGSSSNISYAYAPCALPAGSQDVGQDPSSCWSTAAGWMWRKEKQSHGALLGLILPLNPALIPWISHPSFP